MASMAFQLRQRWHSLFLRRIRCPSKPWSQLDEATIQAVVSVLSAEEQEAGLQQPTGIGQRPKPINPDDPQYLSHSWRSNSGHRSSIEKSHEAPTPDRSDIQDDKIDLILHKTKLCKCVFVWVFTPQKSCYFRSFIIP